jgi:negative regulator of sigma E activity
MRRGKIAAVALAAITLVAADAKSAPRTVDPLLAAAINAPSTVSYAGVVEVVRMGTRTAEAAVYRIEHRAPALTRRSYVAPSIYAGDWVVAAGDAIFSVDPKRRRMVKSRNDGVDDSSALHANYALLRQNYHSVRVGSDIVAGRRTIDIALIDNDTARTTMRVHVDAATRCVLEKEEFAADGAPVSVVRFESISYVTEPPITDFALPKDYAVVRAPSFAPSLPPGRALHGAGFTAQAPQTLPGGFSLVDGNVVELHGIRTMHVLYSDGLRTVSLFESAQIATLAGTRAQPQPVLVGNHSAQYAEEGPTALLTWSDGRLSYTLVGEVGLVDLRRLAGAIGR